MSTFTTGPKSTNSTSSYQAVPVVQRSCKVKLIQQA